MGAAAPTPFQRYPVYVDTNVMAGNMDVADEKGEYGGLIYLRATAENTFTPAIPDRAVDNKVSNFIPHRLTPARPRTDSGPEPPP